MLPRIPVLTSLALVAGLAGQTPTPLLQAGDPVPGSYIVSFVERSFDLGEYREAIAARRPAADVSAIVDRMERAVRADQASFVAAVANLGGTVTDQWWIINGAAVSDLDPGTLPALRGLPNVASVDPNRTHAAVNNTARNATNHAADQANQRRNSSNALVRGTGVSVAVLDTGVDQLFAATGKPHPAYYVGGNQTNTQGGGLLGSRLRAAFGTSGSGNEDSHGHGTHVSGSVLSDFSSYRGMAPGAWLVGVKISDNQGLAFGSWLISGWQLVASQRQSLSIGVANNSFSGSPSLTDPVQRALDTTALNADVLVCVASGNGGFNTAASQNAWNGLAVGAVTKNSLSLASFSGRGPLSGSGRTYPDICGVGVSVVSATPNSTGGSGSSGTSMASPMVAGGGALVRQVDPMMSALEAKAILLATTKGTQTQRNGYGLGVMDCDAAVVKAISHDYVTLRLNTQSQRTLNQNFVLSSGGAKSVVATWMHSPGSLPDNIDARIYDASNTLIAQDGNTLNSYEKLRFTGSPGAYRLELTWVNSGLGNRNLDVAVSGIGQVQSGPPATITNISPNTVSNPAPAEVTLTGTNFDTVQLVRVGGTDVGNFTIVSPATLRFTLPGPAEIATHTVTVVNGGGTSNSVNLTVDGAHPAVLSGPTFAVRGVPVTYEVVGDRGWMTLLGISTSNQPSVLPGVVSLNIGAGFANLFLLGPFTNDSRGVLTLPITYPTVIRRVGLYLQAITVSPTSPSFPLEVSNFIPTGLL